MVTYQKNRFLKIIYFYRSLPKISQADNYLPSITSSIENIPDIPKLPKVTRRGEDLLL